MDREINGSRWGGRRDTSSSIAHMKEKPRSSFHQSSLTLYKEWRSPFIIRQSPSNHGGGGTGRLYLSQLQSRISIREKFLSASSEVPKFGILLRWSERKPLRWTLQMSRVRIFLLSIRVPRDAHETRTSAEYSSVVFLLRNLFLRLSHSSGIASASRD